MLQLMWFLIQTDIFSFFFSQPTELIKYTNENIQIKPVWSNGIDCWDNPNFRERELKGGVKSLNK